VRLGYETTAGQVRQVLTEIREMMLAETKLDAATVKTRLIRFGDASLVLEAFAYVPTLDEAAFLDLQEELLLRMMDIVETSGATLSLPTEAPQSFALRSGARESQEKPRKA
jgi:MscS family membrane protein